MIYDNEFVQCFNFLIFLSHGIWNLIPLHPLKQIQILGKLRNKKTFPLICDEFEKKVVTSKESIRNLTELACDEIRVVFDGHFEEASSEAVLREDEENVFEDCSDLFQFVVVEVLQDEHHDRRDDADEQVDAGLKIRIV